jgi:hypothetical protein
MNEDMKNAWLQISTLCENPDMTELDLFLRTWQLAMAAERKRLAAECALLPFGDTAASYSVWIANGGKP